MSIYFDFIDNSYSLIAYAPKEADSAIAILNSGITNQEFFISSYPINAPTQNFKIFSQYLSSNYDIPVITGAANINSLALLAEQNFQQTIQLTGIVSFSSLDVMTVTNRFGRFELNSEVIDGTTIYPCALFLLRDFQQTCVYIAGQTSESLAIGMSVFLSSFGGPYYVQLSSDDALLVTGSFEAPDIQLSSSCSHKTSPVVSNISIQSLRTLSQNVG